MILRAESEIRNQGPGAGGGMLAPSDKLLITWVRKVLTRSTHDGSRGRVSAANTPEINKLEQSRARANRLTDRFDTLRINPSERR